MNSKQVKQNLLRSSSVGTRTHNKKKNKKILNSLAHQVRNTLKHILSTHLQSSKYVG